MHSSVTSHHTSVTQTIYSIWLIRRIIEMSLTDVSGCRQSGRAETLGGMMLWGHAGNKNFSGLYLLFKQLKLEITVILADVLKVLIFVLQSIRNMYLGPLDFFCCSTWGGHWREKKSVHCNTAKSSVQFLEHIHGLVPSWVFFFFFKGTHCLPAFWHFFGVRGVRSPNDSCGAPLLSTVDGSSAEDTFHILRDMTITGTLTSQKTSPKLSVVTFGTRNWTVRDIPPSHEAISIMKPADKTDKIQWR